MYMYIPSAPAPDLLTRHNEHAASVTCVQVLVGAYLLYLPAFFPNVDISAYKNVGAYIQRLAARPACAATVAARAAAKKTETTTAAAKN